jgi:hypothetical protein
MVRRTAESLARALNAELGPDVRCWSRARVPTGWSAWSTIAWRRAGGKEVCIDAVLAGQQLSADTTRVQRLLVPDAARDPGGASALAISLLIGPA